MPKYSPNINLELPDSPERYDIAVVNKNNLVIDSELHKLDSKIKDQNDLFATKEELNSEIERVTDQEKEISEKLDDEIARATQSEDDITALLENEVIRATLAEEINAKNLAAHNASTSAHSDLRDLVSGLTTRLNTLADSDDTTLDQLSEIVAYIKNNKELIDDITNRKTFIISDLNLTNVTEWIKRGNTDQYYFTYRVGDYDIAAVTVLAPQYADGIISGYITTTRGVVGILLETPKEIPANGININLRLILSPFTNGNSTSAMS